MKFIITFDSPDDTWTRVAGAIPSKGHCVRLGHRKYVVREILWEFGFDYETENIGEQGVTIYVE